MVEPGEFRIVIGLSELLLSEIAVSALNQAGVRVAMRFIEPVHELVAKMRTEGLTAIPEVMIEADALDLETLLKVYESAVSAVRVCLQN